MKTADTTATAIAAAVGQLGSGPLTEAGIARHVAPLFSRVLGAAARAGSDANPRAVRGRSSPGRSIYLANHSLGRPLDATADDVAEAVALWQTRMGDAWDGWSDEMAAYRSRLARLIGAPRPDCVVPKTSAGQGLRTILNSYDQVPKVIATRGEFDSIDLILRQYARRGRIELTFVEAGADGLFAVDDLRRAFASKVDLLVVSQVMFSSGQIVPELAELVAAARNAGARVLLDIYHSVGVIPVDIGALDADFAIGGSYKYLRGGPGACYLYLHPRHLDGTLSTLDVGWFGKKDPFSYQRPDPPQFGEGGDAFLESTPPVLTLYQARAGQIFTQAIGVERLRAYSLTQQQRLVGLLTAKGIVAEGGTRDRGAFTIVRDTHATQWADALDKAGLKTDARGPFLRVCADLLNTDAELVDAVERMAAVVRG